MSPERKVEKPKLTRAEIASREAASQIIDGFINHHNIQPTVMNVSVEYSLGETATYNGKLGTLSLRSGSEWATVAPLQKPFIQWANHFHGDIVKGMDNKRITTKVNKMANNLYLNPAQPKK